MSFDAENGKLTRIYSVMAKTGAHDAILKCRNTGNGHMVDGGYTSSRRKYCERHKMRFTLPSIRSRYLHGGAEPGPQGKDTRDGPRGTGAAGRRLVFQYRVQDCSYISVMKYSRVSPYVKSRWHSRRDEPPARQRRAHPLRASRHHGRLPEVVFAATPPLTAHLQRTLSTRTIAGDVNAVPSFDVDTGDDADDRLAT
ncbi:hypothetical protein EVAR_47433_1 [Eumeta japonica]|uniref:Uncharacterized protein n=1 Tax=Eumeta variegata TaxID=151549 RepID=A0A4C1XZW5_EUMVA|nr:hypothetical protein EVAR_47433_1 [Eumeta japonica]